MLEEYKSIGKNMRTTNPAVTNPAINKCLEGKCSPWGILACGSGVAFLIGSLPLLLASSWHQQLAGSLTLVCSLGQLYTVAGFPVEMCCINESPPSLFAYQKPPEETTPLVSQQPVTTIPSNGVWL